MSNRLTINTLRGVASVVCSAAIALAGAWLLVLVAGTVALLAVLLVAGFYVPLRCRNIPSSHSAPYQSAGFSGSTSQMSKNSVRSWPDSSSKIATKSSVVPVESSRRAFHSRVAAKNASSPTLPHSAWSVPAPRL